jgi:hypothetical protein
MHRIIRKRILKKLGQKTNNVAPPTVSAAEVCPNLSSGYDPQRTQIIYSVADLVNKSLNIATNGGYNFKTLRDIGWNITPDMFPSPDQKNLAMFLKKLFSTLMNNGNAFANKVSLGDLNKNIEALVQSPELRNLSSVNPSGPLSKISNNLTGNITQMLASLTPNIQTKLV